MLKRIVNNFSLDLYSLSLMRMGVGGILVFDILQRWTDLEAHYSDSGILPREALYKYFSTFSLSIHTLSGAWQVQAVLFFVALVFGTMMFFGYKTRLATIASWLLLMSLQNRNPEICYGADSVLRMILFWGIFLPWGSRFSVDEKRFVGIKAPAKVFHAGVAGYILQVLCIYWFTALLKNGVEWTKDFTAVYYALSLDELKTPFTEWLYYQPQWVTKSLTVFTLAWEFFGTFFLIAPWWRVRVIGIIGFFILQLGFGVFLRLGIFPFISSAAILAFIPSQNWNWFFEKCRANPLQSITTFHTNIIKYIAKWVGKETGQPSQLSLMLKLSWPITFVATASILLVLVINTEVLQKDKFKLPDQLSGFTESFKLVQNWGMFAPYPYKSDGWYVMPARLRNGEIEDILTGDFPNFRKPVRISSMFKNTRWSKYYRTLRRGEHRKLLKYFVRYKVVERIKYFPKEQQIDELKIWFMLEATRPDYQYSPPKKILLWHFDRKRDL